jgi:hypothetical protein
MLALSGQLSSTGNEIELKQIYGGRDRHMPAFTDQRSIWRAQDEPDHESEDDGMAAMDLLCCCMGSY